MPYADVVGRLRWWASFLTAEAIQDFVDQNSWQVEEIHKGLAEADGEEFASEGEVKRVAKKWARRAH